MSSQPTTTSPLGGRRAWIVWTSAVAVYLLAVFHRSSLSVAGIAAAERFHISAAQLSSFTFLQLLVYAGMQVPVGILLDRFGSRRVLSTGVLLMTLGQLGMALVPSYGLALGTRALVGIGDAMTFTAVLRLVAAWFPLARGSLLTQFTGLVGQVGAMLAALPMAHALARYGWEASYLGAAAVGVLAGAVMHRVVTDRPSDSADGAPPAPMRLREVGASLRACWRQPLTRLGVAVHFTFLFCPNTVALLWGYPWLVDGQGCSPALAATLLTLLTGSSMVSGPLLGGLITLRPHWRLPFLGWLLAIAVGLWTVVLLWPGAAPRWLLVLLMLAVGTCGPGSALSFDFARLGNPLARIGIALGLVNVGGFVSTVLVVLGIGFVLDASTPLAPGRYSPQAFRLALLVPYLAWAVGGWQVLRCRRQCRLEAPGR